MKVQLSLRGVEAEGTLLSPVMHHPTQETSVLGGIVINLTEISGFHLKLIDLRHYISSL